MRVLFITEFYLDTTNANAYCAHVIAEKLLSNGYDVDIVCGISGCDTLKTHADKKCNVYPVRIEKSKPIRAEDCPHRIVYYKDRLFSILKKSLVIHQFPLQNVKEARMLYHAALDLTRKHTYDAVIAVHKSIESVYAAMWLKKKTGLYTILYELDPLINEIDMKLGLSSKLYPIAKMKEISLYRQFDLVAHMLCHKERFTSHKYRSLAQRQLFLDFPVYVPVEPKEAYVSLNSSERIKCICFGILNSKYRYPYTAIQAMDILRKDHQITIDFYTKGDCEHTLAQMEQEDGTFIHPHGYVSQETLREHIAGADIILNIGNKYSDMVPSKVFQMITYMKPIIHFSLQEKDAALHYLNRYPCVLVIPYDTPIEKSAEMIRNFIEQLTKESVRVDGVDLNRKNEPNTPQYTAEHFTLFITRKKNLNL